MIIIDNNNDYSVTGGTNWTGLLWKQRLRVLAASCMKAHSSAGLARLARQDSAPGRGGRTRSPRKGTRESPSLIKKPSKRRKRRGFISKQEVLKSHCQRGNEVGLFPLLRLAPFVSTNNVRATKTSCDVSHG